ncbi:MBL fold metallo-hydrolase [Phenylobacterium sp.]|jgi:glyoxylase-like metal-dependent hydrolase (beta-lactamase superfamily II)|uniref:MBL fold metallo-hydrolase n=1 Tax=Phenylobacterium sp. TaxID=1871053 RepID=UPI000C940D6B|nr:MBL fold metallo-hydrolase [Phenylobacterium sp.]MAK80729.1 MBL fold metallo-hydrolase [Phenylobacterium sp.]|tara:strand:- start:38182 stop:39081 length:900 start_codon:yes stop_codon:yes gene_type:complete
MIPYVREIQFEYGVCDQVSPLIRRVVARNPGPFTFMGTGTYIVGRGEVAVIDPGPDLPEHLEAILAALEPGERVTHILVTHHHSDHSPLARPLKAKTGAAIYGCAVGAAAEESTIRTEAGADFDFAPDVSLCGGGQVLEGPGWTLEAVATPGHTSNHICFALKEENALFSGDHIMGWSTTVITPPDGDMTDYMESLERVKARDFDVLWPTHGPPIREVTPFIEAYATHRRAREAQVLAAVGEGYERIVDMVPKLYADVDPRLHPAAARSVLGHMIDLVRRGKVATDGPASIDSRYRLAT